MPDPQRIDDLDDGMCHCGDPDDSHEPHPCPPELAAFLEEAMKSPTVQRSRRRPVPVHTGEPAAD